MVFNCLNLNREQTAKLTTIANLGKAKNHIRFDEEDLLVDATQQP